MTRSDVRDYGTVFMAGALFDAILSLDVVWTSHFNVGGVIATTITTTFLSYLAFDRIMDHGSANWYKVTALALGSATGAAIVTAFGSIIA